MIVTLLSEEKIIENKDEIANYFRDLYKINLKYLLNKDEIDKLINDMIKYIEDKSAYIIGVFEENKLIGFLWSYKHDYFGEKRLHINHIVINEEFRNKGIGTLLINSIEKIAIKEGILKIDLLATESNKNVVNFYLNKSYLVERLVMCKELKGD